MHTEWSIWGDQVVLVLMLVPQGHHAHKFQLKCLHLDACRGRRVSGPLQRANTVTASGPVAKGIAQPLVDHWQFVLLSWP